MVQVVETGPVVVDEAQGIPGEDVAAVIAEGFDRGEGAEEHALARRQPRYLAREDEAEDVEEYRLEPVGVYGAVRVGDVEPVVLGVDDTCGVSKIPNV